MNLSFAFSARSRFRSAASARVGDREEARHPPSRAHVVDCAGVAFSDLNLADFLLTSNTSPGPPVEPTGRAWRCVRARGRQGRRDAEGVLACQAWRGAPAPDLFPPRPHAVGGSTAAFRFARCVGVARPLVGDARQRRWQSRNDPPPIRAAPETPHEHEVASSQSGTIVPVDSVRPSHC